MFNLCQCTSISERSESQGAILCKSNMAIIYIIILFSLVRFLVTFETLVFITSCVRFIILLLYRINSFVSAITFLKCFFFYNLTLLMSLLNFIYSFHSSLNKHHVIDKKVKKKNT